MSNALYSSSIPLIIKASNNIFTSKKKYKILIKKLNKEGFTVGHEPDSYEFSTVGGWISTNAAGMKKHRYGNIEDIVQNITMITPTGTVNQIKPLTRASIGIKAQNILFGSEGNLGLITKATLKIHKLPEKAAYESILFHDWEIGVSFMHDLFHSNMVPASSRLADNLQIRFGSSLKEEKNSLFNKARVTKLYDISEIGNIKDFNKLKKNYGKFRKTLSKIENKFLRRSAKYLHGKFNLPPFKITSPI